MYHWLGPWIEAKRTERHERWLRIIKEEMEMNKQDDKRWKSKFIVVRLCRIELHNIIRALEIFKPLQTT